MVRARQLGRKGAAVLLAGGAAVALLGQAHPDLYAAVGVQSGLACGAARDLPSAFAAFAAFATRQGAPGTLLRLGDAQRVVPTIVFHAERDTSLHLRNADQVIAQPSAAMAAGLQTEIQRS
ncbi:MAG TPA: PHB depolymerase family esterase [Roseomonas sp.]|nr:PHB depolymerase family esterase [Roseomonas sp.]